MKIYAVIRRMPKKSSLCCLTTSKAVADLSYYKTFNGFGFVEIKELDQQYVLDNMELFCEAINALNAITSENSFTNMDAAIGVLSSIGTKIVRDEKGEK